MSRAPGKYVAGTMAPAGAALDRPDVDERGVVTGRTGSNIYRRTYWTYVFADHSNYSRKILHSHLLDPITTYTCIIHQYIFVPVLN
jgi:hypothetical protein